MTEIKINGNEKIFKTFSSPIDTKNEIKQI